MTEVICTALTALSAVLVAVVTSRQAKEKERTEKRAERRRRESMLSISMSNATMELSIACCNALCGGVNNGNVEKARHHAEEAQKAYAEFMTKIATEELV